MFAIIPFLFVFVCHAHCMDDIEEVNDASTNRFTLCEHAKVDSKTITCPKGYEIKITKALYGRKTTSVCSGSRYKNTNCGNDKSFKLAQKLCDNKRTCVLKAKNSMFGDPCWGVRKYLSVSYSCAKKNSKEYVVTVKTSSRNYAGTDAKVYVILEGDKRKSEKIFLTGGAYNAFHRTKVSKFTLYTPDVGKVLKVRVGSDNTGSGPAWFPDYITVVSHDSCKITFPINRWLQKGSLEATVFPMYDKTSCANHLNQMKTYTISVKTGDITYASTGAKVYIMLNGKTMSTGYRQLKKSSLHKVPFIRNHIDKFTIEAPDVGNEIRSIRLTHDDTGKGPGWYVDYVTVTSANCESKFRVSQWLTRYNLDVLSNPMFSDKLCGDDLVSYDIRTTMSRKSKAGTNAKVYMIIYGEKGESGKLFLTQQVDRSGNPFASGKASLFKGKGPNVGKITRVKIGADGLKSSEKFLLSQMEIKTPTCDYKFSNMKAVTQKTTTDLYPTAEKCKDEKIPTDKGAICARDFLKVGCYKRDWEKVPDLLVTDLDPTHENYTQDMNWNDFLMGLHSLACRCRAKAAGHYKYFAIGFHGECVSGKNTAGLEKMFKEDEGDGCLDGNYETCSASSKECAGQEDYDFFYKVINWKNIKSDHFDAPYVFGLDVKIYFPS